MERAIATTTPRLIEYPDDLSGCSSIPYGGRNLLYLCSREVESTPFVVVLGFFSGQKQDVITKDLMELVSEADRREVANAVSKAAPVEFSKSHIFFL
jgi:hypothetical protein